MTNKPTHHACQAIETKERVIWNRIGAAWPHKNGKGFNIKLDSVPLDGEIVLFEIGANETAEETEGASA
ncbi:hypothetical protein ACSHT0_17315 [Tepidicaulis sp. LMO-SS28]|uniref:hypothetical protein n=1 Tax=Tepidicaulis sp. LMO-SS28 TaxID=3447455 RepID=UPI003EE0BEB4